MIYIGTIWKMGRRNLILVCRRGTFVAFVNVSIQQILIILLPMAFLVGAVSQLLVDLGPRTVKGQHGVEFNFQSI